jgi:hypothetical protein
VTSITENHVVSAFGSGTAFAAARERVRNPLHRSHGNLELAIAKSADADRWNCSKPFEHAKPALFHVFEVSRCSTFHFEEGQRVAPAGPYDQKSFELIRAKIFSTGVTKIAVRKLAI